MDTEVPQIQYKMPTYKTFKEIKDGIKNRWTRKRISEKSNQIWKKNH